MPKIDNSIRETLRYFAHFRYSPTFDEVFIFLKTKTSKKELKKQLDILKDRKYVIEKDGKYTIGEYSKYIDMTVQKRNIAYHKLDIGNRYIQVVSNFPYIRLIALSGSLSMNNTIKSDDIDLFIVASEGRMWITRLYCLLIAELLGVRRRRYVGRAPDKVCLNMFFDESNLCVPEAKKNRYVAHEVLQLKPIVNKYKTYEKFLFQNNWVFTLFPNAQKYYIQSKQRISNNIKNSFPGLRFFGNIIEQVSKFIQLFLINRHRTNERISDTQLWFFPHDFELKLKRKMK